jgi:formylglycine-generating enzyme required for sulfatase activity
MGNRIMSKKVQHLKSLATVVWVLFVVGRGSVATAGEKAIRVVEAVRELAASLKTPNRYALVIGVGQYADNRIPKLPAGANDARWLAARYLPAALDAIETPQQRVIRLEREARERGDREKSQRFASLLAQARAMDNRQDGKEALQLLEETLQLHPGDADVRRLETKIAAHFDPNAGDVVTNSLGMRLVWIPPGEFLMGSPTNEEGRYDDEGPRHRVTLTKGFYLGVHEVTQRQWRTVMGDNPSHFKGDDLPVESISWEEAVEFCRKLSTKEGVEYRLPTEAQWEYACRAGTTSRYNFGDSEVSLGEYAWYGGNSDGRTHPVGQKKANAFGLYDMHGNVWEWCQDWFGSYAGGPVTDPLGPASGANRVGRGGGWYNNAGGCRSADRGAGAPGLRDVSVGLRLARSMPSCP